jgi:hypothetical protein
MAAEYPRWVEDKSATPLAEAVTVRQKRLPTLAQKYEMFTMEEWFLSILMAVIIFMVGYGGSYFIDSLLDRSGMSTMTDQAISSFEKEDMSSSYTFCKKVLLKNPNNIKVVELIKDIIRWNLLKGKEKEMEGDLSSAEVYYQKANDIVKDNYDWLDFKLMREVEERNTSIKIKAKTQSKGKMP